MFAAFKDIWGNQALLAGLGKALETGKLAHAYLIMGVEGTQKETLAHAIASAILCDAPAKARGACGQCDSCQHLQGGGHPDYHAVYPDGQSLKIEQIHALRGETALHGFRSEKRVFVIFQAETLTEAATNSFLKILEEPPAGTHFILCTGKAARLSTTVISRCQILKVDRPSLDELEKALIAEFPNLRPEEAADIARHSQGLPERARRAAAPEELARRQADIALRERIMHGDLADLFKLATELEKNKDEVERLLVNLSDWFGTDLGLGLGLGLDPGRSDGSFSAGRIRAITPLLEEIALSRQLIKNVNPRLVLDVLFIEILRLRGLLHGSRASS